MAFVLDPTDPSGQGMFSKPGRFTSEKHIIFQKKEEILNNQRKFLRVTTLPTLKLEPDEKPNEHKDEEDLRPQTATNKKTRPVISLFERAQSREELARVRVERNPPPPIGFYNPKYKQVEVGSPVLFSYKHEKPKPELKLPEKQKLSASELAELSSPIPEKPKKKLVGPIPFMYQTPRGKFYSNKGNPHEERFKIIPYPPCFSKSQKQWTIDMSKCLGRERNNLYKNQEYAPDYAPNWEYGKKRLGSCGPKFNKMSARKPLMFKTVSLNDDFLDPEIPIRCKSRGEIRTPKFERYLPREYDPSSPLPSFMQKHVTSRLSIGTLSQKMLEINHYSDGKFQTVTSCFGSPLKG